MLPTGSVEFPAFVHRLQLAHQGRLGVGLSVDEAGRIRDVAGVDRDIVLGVEAKDAMTAVAVWFGKQDGLMALMKDHPRFHELVTLLNEAGASKAPIWYVTRSGCVLDVLQLRPEEDAVLNEAMTG